MCVCVFERKRKCETGVHTFTQLSCKHFAYDTPTQITFLPRRVIFGSEMFPSEHLFTWPFPQAPGGQNTKRVLVFLPSKQGEACPCFSFALTSTDLPTHGILCEKVPELSHRSEEAADNHFFCASRVPSSGPGTRREVGQGNGTAHEATGTHRHWRAGLAPS